MAAFSILTAIALPNSSLRTCPNPC